MRLLFSVQTRYMAVFFLMMTFVFSCDEKESLIELPSFDPKISSNSDSTDHDPESTADELPILDLDQEPDDDDDLELVDNQDKYRGRGRGRSNGGVIVEQPKKTQQHQIQTNPSNSRQRTRSAYKHPKGGDIHYVMTNEDSTLVVTVYKKVDIPSDYKRAGVSQLRDSNGRTFFAISEPRINPINKNNGFSTLITHFLSARKIEYWENNKIVNHGGFNRLKGSKELHYITGKVLTKGNIIVRPYNNGKITLPNGEERDYVLYAIWVDGKPVDEYSTREATKQEICAWRRAHNHHKWNKTAAGAQWYTSNKPWYDYRYIKD